jgi:hypothetical protein
MVVSSFTVRQVGTALEIKRKAKAEAIHVREMLSRKP